MSRSDHTQDPTLCDEEIDRLLEGLEFPDDDESESGPEEPPTQPSLRTISDLLSHLACLDWHPAEIDLWGQKGRIYFGLSSEELGPVDPALLTRLQTSPGAAREFILGFVQLYRDPFLSLALGMLSSPATGKNPRSFTVIPSMDKQVFSFSPDVLQQTERHTNPWLRDPRRVKPLKRTEVSKEEIEPVQVLSPSEMYDRVRGFGYVGQEEALRMACVFAHRHLKRLRLEQDQNPQGGCLPVKDNLLLAGPTGSGKTRLMELIFRNILDLPFVIVDMSQFTETGYAGRNVTDVMSSLIDAAGGDIRKAERGVVCLDEFDKLSGSEYAYNANGNPRWDKGQHVQRELLRMVEGGQVVIPGENRKPDVKIETAQISFIASGAFSWIAELQDRELKVSASAPIGFLSVEEEQEASTDNRPTPVQDQLIENGFMPELVGRFTRYSRLRAHTLETLGEIFDKVDLPLLQQQSQVDGFQLDLTPAARRFLLQEAHARGLGARGLRQRLGQELDQACFESALAGPGGTLRLCVRNGELTSEFHSPEGVDAQEKVSESGAVCN